MYSVFAFTEYLRYINILQNRINQVTPLFYLF